MARPRERASVAGVFFLGLLEQVGAGWSTAPRPALFATRDAPVNASGDGYDPARLGTLLAHLGRDQTPGMLGMLNGSSNMVLNMENDRVTPRSLLGRRLLRLREQASESQRALADRLGYPFSYIGRVERGEQLPSKALAEALDIHYKTCGLFVDMLEVAQDAAVADYTRDLVEREKKATRIKVFDSSLVPGLLQTESYARALTRATQPWASEERVVSLVEARMRRQWILEQPEPPYFWAVLDEAALKRPIGGAKCMGEQLARLLDTEHCPHVTLQVLPFTQGEHPILAGSLHLLTLKKGGTIGYAESFTSGDVVESPQRILKLTQQLDIAHAKALPEKESLDLIRTYLKEQQHDDDS